MDTTVIAIQGLKLSLRGAKQRSNPVNFCKKTKLLLLSLLFLSCPASEKRDNPWENPQPVKTTITSQPPSTSTSADATFTFTCTSLAPCTFECQLDGGLWQSCTSPKTYTGLTAGSHTFSVRALDAAGNVEGSPPAYSWLIDLGAGTWQPTSTINAPEARFAQAAVWTGSKMIIWGGWNGTTRINTGGQYNPSTDTWQATNTIGAPAGREWGVEIGGVWTGTEMIVWGGRGGGADCGTGIIFFNDGGRYNPSTDSWGSMASTGLGGRDWFSMVWTGTQMIIFGGSSCAGNVNDGRRYNPSTNLWSTMTTVNAPPVGYSNHAVWTGSVMVEWGGYDGFDFSDPGYRMGGRYNPSADTWTPTTLTNAPSARDYYTSVWTGTEAIFWGGAAGSNLFNTGGRYNPTTDIWEPTSTIEAPTARKNHRALWTGTEMIIWGGDDVSYTNTGGRYNPSTDTWQMTSLKGAPSGRVGHSAVWTGTEMIIWGGCCPMTNTGGRYTP